MREIIFRGKTEKGEWVYGDLLHPDLYGNGYSIEDFTKGKNNCFDVIPETVGQYTGLTDKNGKKIFEGDIIRYADIYEYYCYLESLEHPEGYRENAFKDMWTVDKVVYDIKNGYPAFDLYEHDFDCNGLSELKESMQYYYEVIGNIHDNNELIGGDSDA